jgi:propanediol dehydratase small subunit
MKKAKVLDGVVDINLLAEATVRELRLESESLSDLADQIDVASRFVGREEMAKALAQAADLKLGPAQSLLRFLRALAGKDQMFAKRR